MLVVEVPERELFDNDKQEFITLKQETFQIEHSLVSLSKWESKWCIPFLGKDEKTTEQTLDYIRCMTTTQRVDPNIYTYLPSRALSDIQAYIDAPMTATWFNDRDTKATSRDIITAEVIYYWMIAQNIPMECQKWHLNRLLTLIKVCSLKNAPPKKQRYKQTLRDRAALNAARRNQLGTKG